jgi:acyl-CoA reductase-like NAD-dependent aldehyde dehydrogenase
MFIDGKWTGAASGRTYDVPNPATEESIGAAPDADVEDMRRAIAAARKAFDEGPWPRSTRAERHRALMRIADALERRKEEMRALLVKEAAATYIEHAVQVDAPIEQARAYAELALRFEFEEPLPSRATMGPLGPQMNSGIVWRQPVGVCGMIPTWNFPVFVAMQKLGPALATGCTMVFKSSPYGPLINLFLAEVCAEADLPPGVVNWVTGQSPAIGQALCEDPRVDKVSFTGSVATGKAIMAAASKTLKRVHLELGGKSVGLYLDTDNIQMQAMTACGPAMFHAGQGCAMSTRVLVPKDRHDEFVGIMAGFVQGMVRIGDPADPTVMLGPVIREERRQKIEEYIESGKRQATLVTGGRRPKDLAKGYFLEPTIFANVPNSARIAQEEIFGPVVSVIPFATVDEAVRIANDSSYGLGGGIYSSDVGKAVEVAKRIRTGVVWINNGLLPMSDAPFGGFKESGIGREGGKWGMEEYTEVQQITWKA